MAWTDTARRQHIRNGPRYPSDLRDEEWALIEPMFPAARSGGRPRTTCLRMVMDAILYIASSGCAWRMLPKYFPPIFDDGAVDVLKAIRFRFPWLRHVFADGGYAGDKLKTVLQPHGSWTLEIIKRSDAAKGFELLSRRWVVERTFAWLGRCSRLAKDWERSIESSTAWATIASIRMLTHRIARPSTH